MKIFIASALLSLTLSTGFTKESVDSCEFTGKDFTACETEQNLFSLEDLDELHEQNLELLSSPQLASHWNPGFGGGCNPGYGGGYNGGHHGGNWGGGYNGGHHGGHWGGGHHGGSWGGGYNGGYNGGNWGGGYNGGGHHGGGCGLFIYRMGACGTCFQYRRLPCGSLQQVGVAPRYMCY